VLSFQARHKTANNRKIVSPVVIAGGAILLLLTGFSQILHFIKEGDDTDPHHTFFPFLWA